MPLVRFTSQLNGYTALCLTKTDILDKLDEVKIGVAYVKVAYYFEKLTYPIRLCCLSGKPKLHTKLSKSQSSEMSLSRTARS